MSDEPIFNENSQDVILGTPTSKVRDFIVNNSRNTKFNTEQGLDVITSGGSVLVDTSGGITSSGSITTPLTVFANQGTFTANVTAASVIAAFGQFATVAAPFKLFDIPHPQKEGMRLRHGSLEGPELAVYARGKTTEGIIPLPGYWKDLVDENTLTVHLTPTNFDQTLVVHRIFGLEIQVAGNYRMPYYYMVMAERKDVPKLEIETHA
jgi:hypothetical protein